MEGKTQRWKAKAPGAQKAITTIRDGDKKKKKMPAVGLFVKLLPPPTTPIAHSTVMDSFPKCRILSVELRMIILNLRGVLSGTAY